MTRKDYGEAITDSGPNAGKLVRKTAVEVEDMVERVAKAAFESLRESYFAADHQAEWPSDTYAADASVFRHAARAAIAAMRFPEPTEDEELWSPADPRWDFNSLIDAALKLATD